MGVTKYNTRNPIKLLQLNNQVLAYAEHLQKDNLNFKFKQHEDNYI